jgi:hypothetical protein
MDTDAEAHQGNAVRRSDRWAAGSAERRRNWWAVVGLLVVLTGYGVAGVVVTIVTRQVEIGDDAALALVGAGPALAALGVLLGIVGVRRDALRWLSWITIVLGGLLGIASVAAIVVVTLAFRTFS